jgi:hypothetical protein
MTRTPLSPETLKQTDQFAGSPIAAHGHVRSNPVNFPSTTVRKNACRPQTIVSRARVKLEGTVALLGSGIASMLLIPELTTNRSIVSISLSLAESQSLQVGRVVVDSFLPRVDDDNEAFWKGTFALPSNSNVLFSRKIEVKVNDLPSWEPFISVDSDRLEDDDD